jgi:transcription initiation factor TFIIB
MSDDSDNSNAQSSEGPEQKPWENAPRKRAVCPECGSRVRRDSAQSESVCENCGLVTDEQAIDRGPEWRSFNEEQRQNKSRVGAPTTPLMHDKGLSTIISWSDTDAHGRPLPSRKRARFQRLRQWDERFRTQDAQDRTLKQAFDEIDRMASALGLPETVRETAGVLYRRAVEDDLLPGRSIEGMATAALYASARQQHVPRSPSAVERVSRVEKTRFQRAYRYLSRELALEIEPESPAQHLPQLSSTLDVTEEAHRRAEEILEVAQRNGVHSGKSPVGVAASALYAATYLTNEKLTQETVSSAADISKVTIRTRYQELLDVYAESER